MVVQAPLGRYVLRWGRGGQVILVEVGMFGAGRIRSGKRLPANPEMIWLDEAGIELIPSKATFLRRKS